jgi:hypothetical protein
MGSRLKGKLREASRKLLSLYNGFVPETKQFRLTESVKAAG